MLKLCLKCTIHLFRFIVIFVNVKMFPAFATFIGLSAIFWIHSIICFLTCILAMFILPETQGKTLTELSLMYAKGWQNEFYALVANSQNFMTQSISPRSSPVPPPKIIITDCNGNPKSKYVSL